MSSDTAHGKMAPVLLVAGLIALGWIAAIAPVQRIAPRPKAPAPDRLAGLTLVVSTPQVDLPQPVFDAENAMPLPDRLARWNKLIDEASKRFGVPRDWIVEVMRQESGGRTVLQGDLPITSDKGAMGLMQVMPQTYRDMRLDYRLGDDPYDPRNSVLAGTAYLKFLNGKYGYPALFAAYNTGPGNLEANLLGKRNLPQETIAYLTNIRVRLGDSSTTGGSFGGLKAQSATVTLTRPDGETVTIDAATVKAVRAALPGEYPPSVAAVVDLGKNKQAVREDVASTTQLLKKAGAKL
jgi:membrane-bound lytic murein transglycosylase B